ncbi:MAG TPA: hypothetical protein VGR81_06365 [Candidatus Acidoferrales bacterium]|nr:hypothetical protein [Candidatus Acidoferrales bacterium]
MSKVAVTDSAPTEIFGKRDNDLLLVNQTPNTMVSTAASVTGGIATISFTVLPGFIFVEIVGTWVFIAGFTGTDAVLNGAWQLISFGAGTFSFKINSGNFNATSNGKIWDRGLIVVSDEWAELTKSVRGQLPDGLLIAPGGGQIQWPRSPRKLWARSALYDAELQVQGGGA